MTIADLENILSEFPPHYRVVANRVGNLAVCDHYMEYLGFIDLLEGKFNDCDERPR